MPRRLSLVLAALGVASLLTGSSSGRLTVTWSEPEALGAGTAITTSTQLYRFGTVVNGKPVRWNPCAPIYWQYRPTGGPAGALTSVQAAVNRVAQLTGTRWIYKGTTSAVPTSAWLPRTVPAIKPVLIGWADGASSDLLRGQAASVLAVTRSAYFGTTVGGVSVVATKAMVIALDRTNKLPLTGALSWKSVMLHELAHGMGLAHVSNTRQMMHPMLQRTLTDLQSGDRAGLYKLGRAAGCINLGF